MADNPTIEAEDIGAEERRKREAWSMLGKGDFIGALFALFGIEISPDLQKIIRDDWSISSEKNPKAREILSSLDGDGNNIVSPDERVAGLERIATDKNYARDFSNQMHSALLAAGHSVPAPTDGEIEFAQQQMQQIFATVRKNVPNYDSLSGADKMEAVTLAFAAQEPRLAAVLKSDSSVDLSWNTEKSSSSRQNYAGVKPRALDTGRS